MKKAPRVWYLKGGHAVEELEALYPRMGELPVGGPDQYLLTVLHLYGSSPLVVTTLGDTNRQTQIGHLGARCYAARPVNSTNRSKRWAFAQAAACFFVDLIRFRPTKVFCGVEGPIALLCWLGARLSQAEFWYFSHCALDLPSTSKVYRMANRLIVQRADRIISNGPYLAAEAVRLGAPRERVTEFNVGLDAEHELMLKTPPASQRSNDMPTIVYAGRMEADKGIFDLLAAFTNIRKLHPCRLIYLGNGAARDALTSQVQQLEHRADIQVLGQRPLDEVLTTIRNAEMVVTPTRSTFPEGRCKTVLEAFFAGIPVVAPNFGPFPHAVRSEYNGLLYEPDSVPQLTRTIAKLITDRAYRNHLAAGAAATGEALKRPHTSFASALQQGALS